MKGVSPATAIGLPDRDGQVRERGLQSSEGKGVAVRVEDVSKCYHIYDTPRDRLKQFLLSKLHKALGGCLHKEYFRQFWALRGISFEVNKGETVGIVGRNGSGKSTLLQIICGTLSPSSGSVETAGRVSALLELGAGFNPDFTGRENVYLNGAVLGLNKDEIDARYNDIITFADIGDFVEQPVKTYSSGMVVRLAFAVAINVDPEILIVDEALSVGDELFQRKCFARIEAIRDNGATILFVSHSGGTVIDLCDRAILLDGGEKLLIGAPKQVFGAYQKMLYAPVEKQQEIREQIREKAADEGSGADGSVGPKGSFGSAPLEESFDPHLQPTSTIKYESRGAVIQDVMLISGNGERVNNLVGGKPYRFRYSVQFFVPAMNVRFGMMIKTTSGIELGGGASARATRDGLPFVAQESILEVEFAFRCVLNPGVYFLNAGVLGDINGSETFLHRLVDVSMFRVLPADASIATGIVDFDCSPTIAVRQ